MVVSIKPLFVTAYPSLGGAIKPAPAPAEPPVLFSVGDTIRLKSHDSPYKGPLKCGKSYVVRSVNGDLIGLIADNETNGYFNGYFRAIHFELYTTSSADIAADEYDEAILAQEIMEQQ